MAVHVRSLVVGKVSGPVSEIWVVVRPKQTDDYWVTRGIGVLEGTFWLREVRFGRDGNLDVGVAYQVAAFVNPKMFYSEKLPTGGRLTQCLRW